MRTREKQKIARALGRLARGKRKTISPAALEQRRAAWKHALRVIKQRKKHDFLRPPPLLSQGATPPKSAPAHAHFSNGEKGETAHAQKAVKTK